MNEKISVIVPIYNVENYLDRCIKSIVNQTYSNLEIILIDDGSPDNCPQMCDRWSEKDNRIVVVHKSNGGLSDARNVGLTIATGEYIAFVDSDDWIEKEFINQLYETIQKYGCCFAGCKFRMCENLCEADLNFIEKEVSVKVYDTISGLSALIDDEVRQVVWNKLYKKSLIENISFEKGKYHEDEFWSYQIFAQSKKYVEIDYIGYNYFQRETSIMGEKYSTKRLDAIKAKIIRQEFLELYYPMLKVQGQINLIFSCIYQGQQVIKNIQSDEQKNIMKYLENITQKFGLNRHEYKFTSLKNKLWLKMSSITFTNTCKIRNYLNIGV